ncbi:UDP-glycosyltransferase [Flavobacteriaceae sp. LMIT009]
MKILVITESIDVNDSSATKGRNALIRNLKESGVEVKVYHYTRKDLILEGIDCEAIRERKLTILFLLSKIQLLFKRWFNLNTNKFVEERFGFSLTFFNDVASIKKRLRSETNFKPDWILTLSKAASFRTHMALLRIPKWHHKWLAYIHDPYPMCYYPNPYKWDEPGYEKKVEFFEKVSKKSAYVIYPSLLLKEWMNKYYPLFMDKSIIIPHQVSESLHHKKKEVPIYFDKNSFTIFHAGSLMKPRNPKGLVEAFQLFLKNNPQARNEVQLLFIGKNGFYLNYLNHKKNEIPQMYVSDGYVDFKTVLAMQKRASVNVIIEAKAEISPFLPGKFAHCIIADKPILHLGPTNSETMRLLGKNYDYHSSIDDVNEIYNKIERLYNLWLNSKDMLFLDREDLKDYLSVTNLKKVMSTIG